MEKRVAKGCQPVLNSAMKTFLLSLTLVAFAVAVQAGETKDSKDKTKSGTAQVSSTTAAKAECTADKAKAGGDCSACCKGEVKKQAVKQTLLSPKAAAEKGI